MVKGNIREATANKLQLLSLLLSSVRDGAKIKAEIIELAINDVETVLSWLDKNNKTQPQDTVRKKAIDLLRNLKSLCEKLKQGKDVTKKEAETGLSNIEEIMNWLDQRKYSL
jgi:hypothetical protein